MIEKHYLSFFGILVIVRSTRNARTTGFRVALVHEHQTNEDGFVLDDPDAEERARVHKRAYKARRRQAAHVGSSHG